MSDNRHLKILVVDDNEALRYTLVRSLQDGGFQVLEAKNGMQALEVATTELPDLITLDVRLPDIDGFEVCRRIKENPTTAHIPVLHISATFVDAEHRVRGLRGGADAYLAEPIEKDELLASVDALLRLKRAESDARRQAAEAEKAKEELRKTNETLELRVKERTAELEQRTQQIQELTGHLLRLQDAERRRVARELHDSTGQMLVALNVNLALLNAEVKGMNPKVEQVVADSASLIEEMTRQIRTMSYLLHPPLLDETGLRSALAWYVEGFSSRSNIKVSLQVPAEMGRLSPEMEITVFRIVQECLTNIHRHSDSKSAEVRIDFEPDWIKVEVSDEGDHKPKPKERPGFVPGVGFLGMQERVRQFGGTLQLSTNNGGTVVQACLPLPKLAAESA